MCENLGSYPIRFKSLKGLKDNAINAVIKLKEIQVDSGALDMRKQLETKTEGGL